MLIDEQKAAGVSGEALAKFTAEMDKFKIDYANPLFRLPMTFTEIFPVGVLVSLVSAGLLRNSRFSRRVADNVGRIARGQDAGPRVDAGSFPRALAKTCSISVRDESARFRSAGWRCGSFPRKACRDRG